MPQTPTYGFEYETPQSKPGITLTGDVDGSSPILAEQVETVVAGIDSRLAAAEEDVSILQAGAPHDTGWLTLTVTAATGYSLTTSVYRQWGPVVMIRIQCLRTGADVTAGSSGNVTGDPEIATIDTTTLRPTQQVPVLIHSSVTSGAGTISTAGVINLTDLHSNSSVRTDDSVRIYAPYFVDTFV